MENIVVRTQKLHRAHKRRERWLKVVTVLSSITLFCTVYAMMMPASTQSTEIYCGYEEHLEHTEDCFEEQLVLVCDQEECEGHVHTEECYTQITTLICGEEELEAHTHSEACYAEVSRNICGLEECEGHTHSEACYSEVPVLTCDCEDPEHVHTEECYTVELTCTCGLEECEGHTHSEGCFETTIELVCGKEETEGHTHTDACYLTETVLSCDKEECEGHTHSEACYEHKTVQVCDLEIHEHTLQCYSNPEADVESESVWEASFSHMELSGNWKEDLAEVAKSQLGYSESIENYSVLADGVTKKGYTRYGQWNGTPYEDWNTLFAGFCMDYAGFEEGAIPFDFSAEIWAAALAGEDCGLYRSAEEYTPVAGDLVFLDTDADEIADRVGIVIEITEDGYVKTVEGDVEGKVAVEKYLLAEDAEEAEAEAPAEAEITETAEDAAAILGYAEMPTGLETEEIIEEEMLLEDQPENLSTIETVTEEGALITLTGADLPEGAEIKAVPLDEETLAEILAQTGAETFAFAYDITIVDTEGNEWQPDEFGAAVTITGLDVAESDVSVAHMKHEGDVEILESCVSGDEVSFTTSSFSPYVVLTQTVTVSGTNNVVTVEMSWDEEPTDTGLSVSVQLCDEDGNAISGKTLTLSSSNSWTGSFTGLDAGTYTISYEEVSGYTLTVSAGETTTETTGKTISTTAATSVADGTQIIIENNRSGKYVTDTVDSSKLKQTSSQTDAAVWTVVKDGTSYKLKNSADSYLTIGYKIAGLATDLSSSGVAVITISGSTAKIYSTINNTKYYLNDYSASGTYVAGWTSYNSDDGSKNTVYTVTSTTTTTTTYTITAEKQAQTGTQLTVTLSGDSKPTSVAVTLYKDGAATDTTATLSSTNNYTYTFTELDSASTYTVKPATVSGYTLTVGASTTTTSGEVTTISVPITSSVASLKVPDHSKYIDWLGDEGNNPDTDVDDTDADALDKLYRLYLDVGPESTHTAVDVLFVIDASTTMDGSQGYTGGQDATDILGNTGVWRSFALDSMLNGEATGTTPGSTTHQTSASYANGLIQKIGSLNAANKVAAVTFCKTGSQVLNWTTVSSDTKVVYTNSNGTNYIAGLQKARDYLAEVKDDGRKKIMIFLSDGSPNYYCANMTSTDVVGSTSYTDNDGIANTQNVIDTYFWTDSTIKSLKDAGLLDIYTIGLGDDFTGSSSSLALLNSLSTNGTTYTSGNFSVILDSLDEIITSGSGHYSNMKMTDTLSAYVDFYASNLDLKVQRITENADGSTTTLDLYTLDTLTGTATKGSAYDTYLKSVTISGDTVTVEFKDDLEEEGSTIYRLSFNITTNETADSTYKANVETDPDDGYNSVEGDGTATNRLTDYSGNTTSSQQGGFYSNESAVLEYDQVIGTQTYAGQSAVFDKPVVQVVVEEDDDPVTPVDDDTEPYHRKYIDYLGDNSDNPDTTIDNGNTTATLSELYRLYLDIGPESAYEAVDVLFILDVSNSMCKNSGGNDATDINGNPNVWRSYALDSLLNGEAEEAVPGSQTNQTTLYANGLISLIGNLNPDNKIAIATFSTAQSGYEVNTSNKYNYVLTKNDSYNAALGWSTLAEIESGYTYVNDTGTNYIAGLTAAKGLLEEVADDGRKKIMIFISDGVPNLYYTDLTNNIYGRMDGTTNTSVKISVNDTPVSCTQNVITSLKTHDVYGNSVTDIKDSEWYSIFGNVDIYTIGVGNFSTETLNMISTSGTTITSTDFKVLMSDIDEVVTSGKGHFKDMVVTDTLSDYVDFCKGTGELELKVQLVKDGTTTDLYTLATYPTSGSLTETITGDAAAYLESVTISGKTITVEYAEFDYGANTTLRLSFNVKVTDYAKELGNTQYNATGESLTDYEGNKTSSGMPGFYSNNNDKATLTYTKVLGNTETENQTVYFQKPVVQVSTGYILPKTGGVGTDVFTAAGTGLILASAVLGLKRRKKARKSAE